MNNNTIIVTNEEYVIVDGFVYSKDLWDILTKNED